MGCWFPIYCKPRQELIAQENLARQGFQVFLPRIQIRKRRRGQWVDVIEVLFPRYIFIRTDPDKKSIESVRSTRGVVGMVRFGGQPAVVADDVMEAIIRNEDPDSGLHRNCCPPFHTGDQVRLAEGPFEGMEGIFVQEDGEERVIVLLELLGKANKIKVDRDLIVQAA